MKVRLAIAVLCLALLPAQARAYINQPCINTCSVNGVQSPYCTNSCSTPDQQPQTIPSTAENLQDAEKLKEQQVEVEQKKLQLQQMKFQCVASCNAAGGNSREYCEQSCATPSAH